MWPTALSQREKKWEFDLWSLAEDHAFRSNYIRSLIEHASSIATAAKSDGHRIPKVIVQFWHDRRNIPSDVQECLDSWADLLSAGFTRTLFDDKGAAVFIDQYFSATHTAAFNRCFHPAMRCDYFRLCYLLERGGFYLDADEWYQGTNCSSLFEIDALRLAPLCYDIDTGSMIPTQVFIPDPTESRSRIYYVNNNPIIAPPHHPLVACALERATKTLTSSSSSTRHPVHDRPWQHGRNVGFLRYGGPAIRKARRLRAHCRLGYNIGQQMAARIPE